MYIFINQSKTYKMQKAIEKIKTQLFWADEVKLASFNAITFKHAASGVKDKRKGFEYLFIDEISKSRWEIIIEPCHYSNGDRWLVYGSYVRYFLGVNNFYAKNVPDVFNKLSKKTRLTDEG